MFTKISFIFTVLIFSYACSALNPAAFLSGASSALKIENDPRVLACISQLEKISHFEQAVLTGGFDDAIEACMQASHVVLRAFEKTLHTVEGQSTVDQDTFNTILSIDAAFGDFESNNDFGAGKHIINFLVNGLKTIEKIIINFPNKMNANKTEMLLGFNEALGINADELALIECLSDASQYKPIIKGLIANITQLNPVQSIGEIVTMIKMFPELSASCRTTVHGVLNFVIPIEKSLVHNPIKSVERLFKNFGSDPFGLLVYLLTAAKDLQNHQDRQAGQALGGLVLAILDGLH